MSNGLRSEVLKDAVQNVPRRLSHGSDTWAAPVQLFESARSSAIGSSTFSGEGWRENVIVKFISSRSNVHWQRLFPMSIMCHVQADQLLSDLPAPIHSPTVTGLGRHASNSQPHDRTTTRNDCSIHRRSATRNRRIIQRKAPPCRACIIVLKLGRGSRRSCVISPSHFD